MDQFNVKRAKALADDCLLSSIKAGDRAMQVSALQLLARVAISESDGDVAERYLNRGLILAKQVGSLPHQSYNLGLLALQKSRAANPEAAIAIAREAVEIARQSGDDLAIANALVALAVAEPDAREASLIEALTISRQIGAVGSVAGRLRELGQEKVRLGQFDEAIPLLREALIIAREKHIVGEEAASLIHYGRALRATGHRDEGDSKIQEGFELWFKSIETDDTTKQGWEYIHKAMTSCDEPVIAEAKEGAERSWTAIGRYDLVREWLPMV